MNLIHEVRGRSAKPYLLLRALWSKLVEDHSHDWKSDFPIWLPLMSVSWYFAWKSQDPFISDWDGFDYTAQSVCGIPSSLGLGRALFLGYNHLLWKIVHNWFGVAPEEAYLPLRYGVILQSGPAIVGIYALCKELTTNRLASLFGALLVAASPFYIIYSGRVMSEIPAFLMLSWALWWMLRSLRLGHQRHVLIASFLVGLSANIREFGLFYLPFLILAARTYGQSWRLGLKAFGLGVFGALAGIIFWTIAAPDTFLQGMINWYRLSAQERQVHPVTIKNLDFFTNFAVLCSATVAVLSPPALIWVWSRKRLRLLFWLGACGLLADLALLANHDLPVNPRYLLTGMLGLTAVCGWSMAALVKSYRLRTVPLLLALIVLTQTTYNRLAKDVDGQRWGARAAKSYISKLEPLPANAAFIVGARTPLVNFYHAIGARPGWSTIAPGSAWPDEKLDLMIDQFLSGGRPVYVDFDPELWRQGLRTVNREAKGLEMIKRVYKLEPVSGYFYRIVEKQHATDSSIPSKTS